MKCWSWSSNTLATSCKELTDWKRPWCWEGLGAGGEGDDRGWNGWMASPTQWTWVWVDSGSWRWTGRPDVLRFMGSQRVGHDWVTELNWTEMKWNLVIVISINWCLHTTFCRNLENVFSRAALPTVWIISRLLDSFFSHFGFNSYPSSSFVSCHNLTCCVFWASFSSLKSVMSHLWLENKYL